MKKQLSPWCSTSAEKNTAVPLVVFSVVMPSVSAHRGVRVGYTAEAAMRSSVLLHGSYLSWCERVINHTLNGSVIITRFSWCLTTRQTRGISCPVCTTLGSHTTLL